jgi:histone-lysine N-methyltransferase SETMAR
MESDTNGQRWTTWFLWKEGNTPAEIYRRLHAVTGDSCPTERTVYNWISSFKEGRQSVEDLPRSGRPLSATRAENVAQVEQLVMKDRRATVEEIAETVGMSVGTVHRILHEHLCLVKVSARWIPKLLSAQQKLDRVNICKELLQNYYDLDGFYARLVTGDESWFHYYEPESKVSSMQWKHPDSPAPVKPLSTPSAGKRMATVFWDSEGILLIEWLPQGETINSNYYIDVLQKLREAIKSNRRVKLSKKILLHHDNARPHTSAMTTAAVRRLGFQVLPHPAYSPDLAPSDYWLFGPMKNALRGKRYANLAGLASAVSQWVKVTPADWFAEGIRKMPERWEKCVRLAGGYIEKADA